MIKQLTAFVLMCAGFCLKASAQDEFVPKKEFWFGAGVSMYYGDLAPLGKELVHMVRPMGSIAYNRILGDRISARLGYTLGGLMGDDTKYTESAFRQARGLRFTATYNEFSLGVLYNIIGHHYDDDSKFITYLTAGGAYTALSIKRNASKATGTVNPDGLIQDLSTKLPSGVAVFYGGGGMQYKLSQNWKIFGEGTYRVTGNRLVDGYRYATSDKRDDYYTISMGFVLTLGRNTYYSCPRW
jgi:hypothetical protein